MKRTIEAREHGTALVSPSLITEADAFALLQAFGNRLDVQFPTARTGGQWVLTPSGVIGAVRVGSELTLVIRPKVPVASIARMLQHVYDLPVHVLPGLISCRTMPDVYEQLVRALLVRVRGLLRQGLHQRYHVVERSMGAVRGRVLVARHLQHPARLTLPCEFQERTPDVLENRVILRTLDLVLRSGLADGGVQCDARSAHRELAASVSLVRLRAEDIDALGYDRLTQRYREAHALCRLLLEGAGPDPDEGVTQAVPFLLDMPRLFERFVARWLGEHLPDGFAVGAQVPCAVGHGASVGFSIDLVLYGPDGAALCVLDTKYKDHALPAAADLAQVGFYALLKGCRRAGLVYPRPAAGEWRGKAGEVETFRATFDLGIDSAEAGAAFLESLLREIGTSEGATVA